VLLDFQPIELSVEAENLLVQLYEENEKARLDGRDATRMTQQPQKELETLRLIFLVKRRTETLPIGTVYSYSLTRKGHRHAYNLQQHKK
jgi:hypothetical protein